MNEPIHFKCRSCTYTSVDPLDFDDNGKCEDCAQEHERQRERLGISPKFDYYVFEVSEKIAGELLPSIWLANKIDCSPLDITADHYRQKLIAGFTEYEDAEDFCLAMYPTWVLKVSQ